MADDETLLTSPVIDDSAAHAHDYLRFTQMMKYGAVVSFIIGMLVLMILK